MKYDIAIVGGGPAGYSAAFRGAEKGMKVILFEGRELGGTCLNRGCVPTKFWIHTAELFRQVQDMSRYGIEAERIRFDYLAAKQENRNIVAGLRTGLAQRLQQSSVELIAQKAYVQTEHSIIAGGECYEAEHILVATGSRPVVPFLEGAITSDAFLEYDHLPKSVRIIGGGVVAVEFAHFLNALGTKVTICLRGERILRKWDRELAVGLTQTMKNRGIEIRPACTLEQMGEGEEEVVLSAVGRMPNIEGVFADDLGIELEESGIRTDRYGETNIPGIYAAGDVVSGSPLLAHVAMEQGKRIVDRIAGKPVLEEPAVVECIYVQPEIASVGMTETAARSAGIRAVAAKQMMYANARTIISTGGRGFVKLVADSENRRIIGAQLMCERAGDIAAETALAIDQKITVDEFAGSVRPHPSFCEELSAAAVALLGKLS